MKYMLSILACLIFTIDVAAAQVAARVIIAKGEVLAVSGDDSRALKRRSEVYSGDTIRTGVGSSVQLRFVDKALMTLKANSELNIEQYLMADSQGQSEQALMKLVKGGFRTITGSIGKGDKTAYKVSTPAASIGIRGTAYEIQQESGDSFVIGVYNGGIRVENEAGSLDLGLGADYNYSRVSPTTPPKGLLAPPSVLGTNTATRQSSEDDEDSEDESNEESEDQNESEASPEDDSETANEDDSSETRSFVDNANDTSINELQEQVNKALDTKLTEEVRRDKDQFADSDTFKQRLIDELIAAGILTEGQTLDDLPDDLRALLEQCIEQGCGSIISELQDLQQDLIASGFDFNNPYAITGSSSANPFNETIITDEAYALGESGILGVVALPVTNPFNYVGESPALATTEAQLQSPTSVGISNSINYDFSSIRSTNLSIRFEVLNITSNQIDEYEYDILIDQSFANYTELADYLYGAINNLSGFDFGSNLTLFKNGQEVTSFTQSDIKIGFLDSNDGSTYTFTFSPLTGTDEFLLNMELNAHGNDTSSLDLLAALGSTDEEDWRNESGLDLIIGNGSLDINGKPIFVEKESDTFTDGNNNQVNETWINVVQKRQESNTIANGILTFSTCADAGISCDIQVDSVKAADNIRWGAWLADAQDPIDFNDFNETEGTLDSGIEDDILAFWLVAERADINNLVGTATFQSVDTNCLDYSQCIGFADDGVVQKLTAQFDVNFDSGAITNGNLQLETSQDIDIGFTSVSPGAVASNWNVNFSGQMTSDSTGTRGPEFQTNSLSGTVTGSSEAVIGTIGGIFVKPGDTFAGGYNLGTKDGKHATGVFSMKQQP